jgi:hypothetical protein
MKKLIRKIFMATLIVGILSVASNGFAGFQVSHILVDNQIIPVEVLGDIDQPDTFYKDFTK